MTCGILLAAGNSVRFGSNKLLKAFDEQHSIAQRSALNLKQAIHCSLAVVRPDDHQLIQQLQAIDMQIVLCHHAADGMSASIACGIEHSLDATGWVIALADMPLVQTTTIKYIARAIESEEIVAPYYHDRRGNPVGFSAKYREQLLSLGGDKGARELLKTYDARIHRILTDDRGIEQDIDTADDIIKHLPLRH